MVVVVVLPIVLAVVCGIIVEISVVDAFSVAPDWIKVGGIRTPFHDNPLAVILVIPESTRDPVIALRSLRLDNMVITPLSTNGDQEGADIPVRVVAPVFVEEPVRLIGVLAVTNDPVEADDIFP